VDIYWPTNVYVEVNYVLQMLCWQEPLSKF